MSTEETPAGERTNTRKQDTNGRIIIVSFVSFLGMFLFYPGLTLLSIIGMMPTIGARISDPTSTKAQTFCVGFCNIAGLIPSLYELSLQQFNLKAAYEIIHNQLNLLVILSASAFGWFLFFIIPSITISIYQTRDKRNLLEMIKRYEQIHESWGEAVPTYDNIESLKRKTGKSSKETLYKKKEEL